MTDPILIDGSQGEGGGQVLRSALALSLVTRRPFQIEQIRARRPKPGLMAQHLQALEAAAAVGEAEVDGAELRSQNLSFQARGIFPENFSWDIGTAGSTSLVFQTVYLPLLHAAAASELSISGGTHVPWSPCFHYLQLAWIPTLRQMGIELELHMERAGFYPQGGGIIRARIAAPQRIHPLRVPQRGKLKGIRILSGVANLPAHIAERQRDQALHRMEGMAPDLRVEISNFHALSPGTFLLVLLQFENSQACFFSLGEKGKPAEKVADEAVDACYDFLKTDAVIDPYMADQILLPLALADGLSKFRTSQVTQHQLTNLDVIRRFHPVAIEIQGDLGKPGTIVVHGSPWKG